MDQVADVLQDRLAPVGKPRRSRAQSLEDTAVSATAALHPAARPSRAARELRLWLVSLALFAPALVPYVSHFALQPAGKLPTGFIQYDLPYYLANAREHFDGGQFRLFYSNPYDVSYDSPAIYFQPMTLALGSLIHFTGLAPHLILMAFEFLAGWVCARVALALYAEIVGLNGWERKLGLVVFFWGGGLLALAGAAYVLATGSSIEQLLVFDPAHGWWCLNFGRNMIYATEALYHALFFGCILCVIRRQFWAAVALAFLASASHPFTGVELLLIVMSWASVELFFIQSGKVPGAFLASVVALLAVHVGYYLVFLTQVPEHRVLMKRWEQPWFLQAENFVPAYALVGSLAFWSFRHVNLARTFFASTKNRLFLVWFLVAFALANNEFAIKPIQPLHFTRGYIWTALFFLGVPTLLGLFAALKARGGRVLGSLAIAAVLGLLLLDNATWLGRFPCRAAQGRPILDFPVTADQLALYRWMSRPENRGAFLITDDAELGYLAGVYTPLRSWLGHDKNTPDIDARVREVDLFLAEGRVIDAWRGRSLLVVLDRFTATPPALAGTAGEPVFENPTYRVFSLTPAVRSAGGSP